MNLVTLTGAHFGPGVNEDDYLKEPAAPQNQPILNMLPKPFSYFTILPLYDNSAVLIVQI